MFYYRYHPNPVINAAIGFAKEIPSDDYDAVLTQVFTKFKLYPHDLNNEKPFCIVPKNEWAFSTFSNELVFEEIKIGAKIEAICIPFQYTNTK